MHCCWFCKREEVRRHTSSCFAGNCDLWRSERRRRRGNVKKKREPDRLASMDELHVCEQSTNTDHLSTGVWLFGLLFCRETSLTFPPSDRSQRRWYSERIQIKSNYVKTLSPSDNHNNPSLTLMNTQMKTDEAVRCSEHVATPLLLTQRPTAKRTNAPCRPKNWYQSREGHLDLKPCKF